MSDSDWIGAFVIMLIIAVVGCGVCSKLNYDKGNLDGIRQMQIEAVAKGKAEWIPNQDGSTNFNWVGDKVVE